MLTRLKSPVKLGKIFGAKSPAHTVVVLVSPCYPLVCQPIRHPCLTLRECPFPHPGHMADRY